MYKNTDVAAHEIKYIIAQSNDNQNIDNEVPLCLSFNGVDAYLMEGNENNYLIFVLTEKNK